MKSVYTIRDTKQVAFVQSKVNWLKNEWHILLGIFFNGKKSYLIVGSLEDRSPSYNIKQNS